MTDDKSGPDDAPNVKPLDVDGVTAAIAGTVLFAVALVVTLLLRNDLASRGTQWWMWVCVVGIGIGLLLVGYTIKRRATYRAARVQTHKE